MHSLCSKIYLQGRIQDFKLGGGRHLNKLRRVEGGAKIVEVFRVKNHDFTPKKHMFSNFRGWGGGGGGRRVPPPGSAPDLVKSVLRGHIWDKIRVIF